MPTDQKEKTLTESGQGTKRQTKEQQQDKETQANEDAKQQTETAPDIEQQDEQETSNDQLTRKEQKQKRKQEKRKHKKPRRRIFPIWLRLIVVLILSAGALAAGLMVGYGVIGEGNPSDALEWETWQHIIDIVVKEE